MIGQSSRRSQLLRFIIRSQDHVAQRESYDFVPLREHAEDDVRSQGLPTPKRSTSGIMRSLKLVILVFPAIIMACFGLLHIILVVLGHVDFLGGASPMQSYIPGLGYYGHDSKEQTQNISDIMHNVNPIPCHSHNDYWRRVPLFDALLVGCTSVEADVWLTADHNDLYVGHDKAALSKQRTLRQLYINPILELLEYRNLEYRESDRDRNFTGRGVFYKMPGQTLVLLLDLKTAGDDIFPHILKQIEPLREKNHLSFWNGTRFVSRAVTVVLTGDTPAILEANETKHHDVFFDIPLEELWEPFDASKSTSVTSRDVANLHLPFGNRSTAYYASTSFRASIGYPWKGRLSSKQLATIRGQIQGAHKRGLRVRYWNTPTWPTSLRNHIWQVLLDEGSDVLNVDDLYTTAFFDWNRVSHMWFDG